MLKEHFKSTDYSGQIAGFICFRLALFYMIE